MHRRLPAGALAAVLLVACGSPTPSESPTANPTPTPASSGYPNPDGGVCLGGALTAGTFATELFRTPVTYSVSDGWWNYEDLPGNFLLVPPSGSLEGVDAGTSDYIGMYDGVAPASADCDEGPQQGIEPTPEAMAEWYAGLPGLNVTDPQPVTIGGLIGLVFNVTLADGYTGTCAFTGAEAIPVVPMLIGEGPAGLHHVVVGGSTTRLFLLGGPTGQTIAVEVNDFPGGAPLEELDRIVHTFAFTLPQS